MSECPCCLPPWEHSYQILRDADTTWSGRTTAKLYKQAGFTSSLTDSTGASQVNGISWDGTNTTWVRTGGGNEKLELQSGQFTTTIKTSQDVSGVSNITGAAWDGTDTVWTDGDKNFKTSGQFTSTVKTSLTTSSGDYSDISYVDGDTLMAYLGSIFSFADDRLELHSGQFTTTIKTSLTPGSANVTGISYDSADTVWGSASAQRAYKSSGRFTSTVKESFNLSGIDGNLTGITTNTNTTG